MRLCRADDRNVHAAGEAQLETHQWLNDHVNNGMPAGTPRPADAGTRVPHHTAFLESILYYECRRIDPR